MECILSCQIVGQVRRIGSNVSLKLFKHSHCTFKNIQCDIRLVWDTSYKRSISVEGPILTLTEYDEKELFNNASAEASRQRAVIIRRELFTQ